MKIPLLFLLAAATLLAGDVSGKWTGTLIVNTPNGEMSRPAHLELKQDGEKLTGTAGPDATEQHPIENGKAENGTLTFQVPAGSSLMKFVLKHEGDEIKGEITRERDGETETAKLVVKKAS